MRPRVHQGHPDTGFRTHAEPGGVRPDFQVIGDQYRFEHRPAGRRRPTGGDNPFGVIPAASTYREIRDDADALCRQLISRPDAGQHQQVRGGDGAG